MLLRHYLEAGASKAELARRFGVSRRTIHHWIGSGRLDRDMEAGAARYAARQYPQLQQRRVLEHRERPLVGPSHEVHRLIRAGGRSAPNCFHADRVRNACGAEGPRAVPDGIRQTEGRRERSDRRGFKDEETLREAAVLVEDATAAMDGDKDAERRLDDRYAKGGAFDSARRTRGPPSRVEPPCELLCDQSRRSAAICVASTLV